MKIIYGDKFFCFQPVGYEFDLSTCSDIYDANWLNINFEFSYDDQTVCQTNAEILTFEMAKFINDAQKAIKTSSKERVYLDTLEPYFSLSIEFTGEAYLLKGSYVFMLDNQPHTVEFSSHYSKDETVAFIDRLTLEFGDFPYRRIKQKIKAISEEEALAQHLFFKSFDDMKFELTKIKWLNATITSTTTNITVEFHPDFIIEITDFPIYHTKINNKFYYDIEEQDVYEWIKEIAKDNCIFVEYKKPIGLFNRRYFIEYSKDQFNINKLPNKKRIAKIFTASKIIEEN